jgi:hypothetical protein
MLSIRFDLLRKKKFQRGLIQHEALELFFAIESRRKDHSITSGYMKKETGSMVKGVRELLNLLSSMNYDSKRNPSTSSVPW